MPIKAFFLVLVASFAHATWNFLAKRAFHNKHLIWFSSVMEALLFAPIAIWIVRSAWMILNWKSALFLLATGILHVLYTESLFAGERLERMSWLALAGSTVGVFLVVFGGKSSEHRHNASAEGDLLVLLSLAAATGWILANKRLMLRHSPVAVTTYGLLCGFGMLAVTVFFVDGAPPIHGISPRVWWALAASGLLCTASTTLLWNWGLHRVPASRAGAFLNIEPVLGSILGVKLLGDRLGRWSWAGAILLVAAAATLTTTGHTATSRKSF